MIQFDLLPAGTSLEKNHVQKTWKPGSTLTSSGCDFALKMINKQETGLGLILAWNLVLLRPFAVALHPFEPLQGFP